MILCIIIVTLNTGTIITIINAVIIMPNLSIGEISKNPEKNDKQDRDSDEILMILIFLSQGPRFCTTITMLGKVRSISTMTVTFSPEAYIGSGVVFILGTKNMDNVAL